MFGGENVMSIQPWDTQSDRLLCIKDSNLARLFISLLIREGDCSVQPSKDFSGGTTGLSSSVKRSMENLVSFCEQQHVLFRWSSGVGVASCGTFL